MQRRLSIRARVAAWCAGLAVLTGTIGVVVTLAMTSTGLRNAARQTPLPPPDLATPGPRAATDSGGGVRLPPVPDPLSTPQGRRNEGNRVDRVIDSSRWRGLLTVAGLTCASVLAAWWAAGRMLRPIRRMTATAHEVTAPGSGRRIAIEGPPDELHDLSDTIDGMLDRLDQ